MNEQCFQTISLPPDWLKQFERFEGENRLVVGIEIDPISGATISADAITMDLQHRLWEIRAQKV